MKEFGSNHWGRGIWLGGFPQRVCWEFDHAGVRRIIPLIYRFSRGIVFDILTPLDENRMREYYGVYGNDEVNMSDEERYRTERKHPYQDVSIKEIRINKKPVEEGFNSSCVFIVPWDQDKDLSRIRKAYSRYIKNTSCFACHRYFVPYPRENSGISKIKRLLRLERIKSLEFSTWPVHEFFPLNMRFDMTEQDIQKELKFRHPVTGTLHTLYFQLPKKMEIPLVNTNDRRFSVMQLMYETDPPLPEGDSLRFDSTTRYEAMPSGKDMILPKAVSYIGIIGGADGPTSVFIGGGRSDSILRGTHGLPLHRCFSVPNLNEGEPAHFILEGISVKKYESAEYSLGERI